MFKVGDIVMLGEDKYEGKVYGIVTEINEDKEYIQVFWLDNYGHSEESIRNNSIMILGDTNEI
jgi:transcription antitermination factor NusG